LTRQTAPEVQTGQFATSRLMWPSPS